MRTVFAFPAAGRAETIAVLDRHLPGRRQPWVFKGALYLTIDDEESGYLYVDWEPEDLAVLEAATGERPAWAVQVDVSGRVDGTEEVRRLLALLLDGGGVAFDDYTDRAWTLAEIQSDALVEGSRFFDFRTYHAKRDGSRPAD